MVSISPGQRFPLAVWCGWPRKGLETTCAWYNERRSPRDIEYGHVYEVVPCQPEHHVGHPAREATE